MVLWAFLAFYLGLVLFLRLICICGDGMFCCCFLLLFFLFGSICWSEGLHLARFLQCAGGRSGWQCNGHLGSQQRSHLVRHLPQRASCCGSGMLTPAERGQKKVFGETRKEGYSFFPGLSGFLLVAFESLPGMNRHRCSYRDVD